MTSIRSLILDSLKESPMIIDPTEFKLDSSMGNLKMRKKLSKKTSSVVGRFDGLELRQTGTFDDGYLFMVGGDPERIVYLIQTMKENIKGKRPVCQVMLWRSKTHVFKDRITERVFFDILLKENRSIVSDSTQTNEGKDFWFRMMGIAVERGHQVSLINTKTGEEHISPKLYSPWINSLKDIAWGKGMKFADWRFLIEV